MAKFIKSIFTDKRKTSRVEDEEDKDFPPMDGRRKLSISRSGRMKQSRKKRNSLTLDLYGTDYHIEQKPKSLEYHVGATPVNTPIHQETRNLEHQQRSERSSSMEPKSPEEEIDKAFEIIDKS